MAAFESTLCEDFPGVYQYPYWSVSRPPGADKLLGGYPRGYVKMTDDTSLGTGGGADRLDAPHYGSTAGSTNWFDSVKDDWVELSFKWRTNTNTGYTPYMGIFGLWATDGVAYPSGHVGISMTAFVGGSPAVLMVKADKTLSGSPFITNLDTVFSSSFVTNHWYEVSMQMKIETSDDYHFRFIWDGTTLLDSTHNLTGLAYPPWAGADSFSLWGPHTVGGGAMQPPGTEWDYAQVRYAAPGPTDPTQCYRSTNLNTVEYRAYG